MAEKPVATSAQDQFEILISGLIEDEFGICDSFLDPEILQGLRANLFRHFSKGEMKPAGIGRKFDFQKNAQVRGDLIRWMDPQTTNPYERNFFAKVDEFVHILNSTCYTGITDYEFHYALYDVGSYYKRHLDQFKSDKGRQYSLVTYLNEDWDEEDGGRLSLYSQAEETSVYPIEGRIVFFKSDRTEHEVHPSHNRPRISIAGWLKRS